MNKATEKYLVTMQHNRTKVHNHGLVKIDDKGFVTGGANTDIPIEDFGMWMVQDTPFTENEDALFNRFIALMNEG